MSDTEPLQADNKLDDTKKMKTVSSSPARKTFTKSPSSPKMEGKDWQQRSKMSGVGLDKLD